MDMNFNLGTVQTESKSIAQIKPFTISDVILKDVKLDEFKGKKDPDAVYKVIKVRKYIKLESGALSLPKGL